MGCALRRGMPCPRSCGSRGACTGLSAGTAAHAAPPPPPPPLQQQPQQPYPAAYVQTAPGVYQPYPAGAAPAQGVPVTGYPAAAGQPAPAPAAAAGPPPDFGSMSVHDLKAYLTARGANLGGAVERADLVAIAKAMR